MTDVYYNAKVFTADENLPSATAFAVSEGKFLEVGDDEHIISKYGKGTDLNGRRVIPGLIESHAHIFDSSDQDDILEIPHGISPSELTEVLRDISHSEGFDDLSIVKAVGLDLSGGYRFDCSCIDSVISQKPVFIFSMDGHAMLINTAAMRLAHLDRNTKDPGNESYFERDESGELTGMVYETNAMLVLKPFFSEKDLEESAANYVKSVAMYSSLGFTTLFDAATIVTADDVCKLEYLQALEERRRLNMNIFTSFVYHGEDVVPCEELIEQMEYVRDSFSSESIHPTTLKMIADGTLENDTAYLREPYSNNQDNTGCMLLNGDEMRTAALCGASHGFNVHIHAIGDGAVENAIYALRGIDDETSADNRKITKTIAHNQVYNDTALRQMCEAGDIFFQTTPYWMLADEQTLYKLGEDRFKRQFPIGTMQRNGVKITFGSDSIDGEVAINAFKGIDFATRIGEADSGMCQPQSEAITREQALKAYTINGAMQLGAEDTIGSITPGKNADFVILDRDILTVPGEELPLTRPLRTFFRGRCVYEM